MKVLGNVDLTDAGTLTGFPSGGGTLTVEQSGGSPSVSSVTQITISGSAVVTDNGGGHVTISMTPSTASIIYMQANFGGF